MLIRNLGSANRLSLDVDLDAAGDGFDFMSRLASRSSDRALSFGGGASVQSRRSSGQPSSHGVLATSGSSNMLSPTSSHRRTEFPKTSVSTAFTAMRSSRQVTMAASSSAKFSSKLNEQDSTVGCVSPTQLLRQKPWYMINPVSNFIFVWEWVLAFLALWSVVTVPLFIGLFLRLDMGWLIVNTFVDFLFISDVVIRCFTGINKGRYIEYNFRAVVHAYVTSGAFYFDLFSSVPIDLILWMTEGAVHGDAESKTELTRLTKAYRVPRVIRVIRLTRFLALARLQRVRHSFSSLMSHISGFSWAMKGTSVVAAAFLFLHCVTALVSLFFSLDDNPTLEFNYDADAAPLDLGDDESSPMGYLASYFMTTMTLSTVGMGSMIPKSSPELIVCSAMMLIGASFFAIVVGQFLKLLAASRTFSSEQLLRDKTATIMGFCHRKSIPTRLRKEMLADVRLGCIDSQFSYNQKLVAEFSAELKAELCGVFFRQVLDAAPFLKSFRQSTCVGMILASNMRKLPGGQVVFRYGESTSNMYILLSGKVSQLTCSNCLCNSFRAGGVFGQEGVISQNLRQQFTVVVQEEAVALEISRQHVQKLILRDPTLGQALAGGLLQQIDHGIELVEEDVSQKEGPDFGVLHITDQNALSDYAELEMDAHRSINGNDDGHEISSDSNSEGKPVKPAPAPIFMLIGAPGHLHVSSQPPDLVAAAKKKYIPLLDCRKQASAPLRKSASRFKNLGRDKVFSKGHAPVCCLVNHATICQKMGLVPSSFKISSNTSESEVIMAIRDRRVISLPSLHAIVLCDVHGRHLVHAPAVRLPLLSGHGSISNAVASSQASSDSSQGAAELQSVTQELGNSLACWQPLKQMLTAKTAVQRKLQLYNEFFEDQQFINRFCSNLLDKEKQAHTQYLETLDGDVKLGNSSSASTSESPIKPKSHIPAVETIFE